MTAQAAELADRFERANSELIALVEHLTDAQWAGLSAVEGWSAGVVAHHIATDHPILASFVEAVATGRPLPPWTMEMLHEYNARHAAEHPGCTREETVDLLRREGVAAADLVRRLTDAQLDRAAVIPWEGGAPVSARHLIERKLIGHIGEHLDGLKAARRGEGWASATPGTLPPRLGERPHTTPTNPHRQLDGQPSDPDLRAELAARVFALPDVEECPSLVSVPGARALSLRPDAPTGPPEAFMGGREFAHLHPGEDQSLHAMLPGALASAAIAAGWAEPHPVARIGGLPATAVMLYAPRDRAELDVVFDLIVASYRFAGGRDATPPVSG